MKISRSIDSPKRETQDFSTLWDGEDQGLIACWERGREKALESPELAAQAKLGELVLLPWRGGVEKVIKTKNKYGSLRYVAMWQGMRGDDLDLDTEKEFQIICTRTGVPVTYTYDVSKFGPEQD